MMRAPAPVVNLPARAAPSIGELSGNMNSVNKPSSFRPLFQNSPYRPRKENVVARNFFKDMFANVRDDKLYEKTEWKVGDKCDYFSNSARNWLNAEITEVGDRGVQVDVKPGFWISNNAQKQSLRKRFGIKGYSTAKGKALELKVSGLGGDRYPKKEEKKR